MSTTQSRIKKGDWAIVAAAVLGLGGYWTTYRAYAVQRRPPQTADQELAQLEADLPELHAVSRAFNLVAKAARPGVVHIRVSGGEQPVLSEEEIEEYIREHLRHLMPEEPPENQAAPEKPQQDSKPPSDQPPERQIEKRSKDRSERDDRQQLDRQRQQLEQWLRRVPVPPGSGSGILFDHQGHILTNNHVVAGRSEIHVVLYDNREYRARLVGSDLKTDLAVIKIDAPDLHPLRFGDSDQVEVGDWVLAVGSPFGLVQTVTHGIVSAKGRTRIPGIDIDYQDFIQTDAAINPGNSGGPLLNLRGEVVGVNTAIATSGDAFNAGVAFTIPSNRAARIANELKAHGVVARGWLGITFSPVQPEDVEIFNLPGPAGAFVESVLRGSPAEQAGLRIEDVLVELDGVPIQDSEQLRGLVADLRPGDVTRLRVIREGQPRELKVRLGLQPEDLREARRLPAVEAFDIPRLNLSVRTLRPGMLRTYDKAARGVVIWKTPADQNRLAVDRFELITACNGKPVKSVHELNELLREIGADQQVQLEILEPTGDRRLVKAGPLDRP